MRTRLLTALFIVISGLQVSPLSSQQIKPEVLYMDRNNREVNSQREASLIVQRYQFQDTIYFESYSRMPKGLVEKGKYPANQGFDMRNCYMQKFWPNGRLRSEGMIRESWNEGTWNFYDEQGLLYSKVEYVHGMMTGKATRFYPGGKSRYYTYKRNIRTGPSALTDSSGQILELRQYRNDSLVDLALDYFPGGAVKRKTRWQDGKKRWDSLFWENGMPFSCEKYNRNGNLEGRCMMYTQRGKIARYDEYSNGELLQNNCIHPLADPTLDGDDCPPRLIEARYPGGIEKYMEFVSVNQDYPDLAITWRQQGVVEMEFTVAEDGTVQEITQENIIPLGYGLEAESVRLLEKIRKFDPQRLNGKAIPVRIRIPFVFLLQE